MSPTPVRKIDWKTVLTMLEGLIQSLISLQTRGGLSADTDALADRIRKDAHDAACILRRCIETLLAQYNLQDIEVR